MSDFKNQSSGKLEYLEWQNDGEALSLPGDPGLFRPLIVLQNVKLKRVENNNFSITLKKLH